MFAIMNDATLNGSDFPIIQHDFHGFFWGGRGVDRRCPSIRLYVSIGYDDPLK